jgi:vacuolar-type H+-ATPase subunit I/STV1
MRLSYGLLVFVVLAALVGCGSKKEGGGSGGGSSTASGDPKPVTPDKPMKCPAGNVVQDGKCVAVITAEKVDAVVKQQTRLEELAKILEKIDTLAAPIELLAAFRKIEEWKKLAESNDKVKAVDAVVGELDNAIKTLRTFKGGLGEAAARLGNLKGELDRLMKDQDVAAKFEEVRTKISSELKTALGPLAQQVQDTIKNAMIPLSAKLEEISAVIDVACGTILLGGGKDAKDLCKKIKAAFATGLTYFDELKNRPAKIFEEVYTELEKQLKQLIDAESKKLLDAAQAKVNDVLKLPAGGGSGSGSAK